MAICETTSGRQVIGSQCGEVGRFLRSNTLFADSYALLGFRGGFRQSNGFSLFLDCKNLTNQGYASSIDVFADARTEPNPEIFHPGDGRSFYGGISWSW